MFYSAQEKNYLQQAIRQIKGLIMDGKYEEAYQSAQELLTSAPDFSPSLSIYRKAEKAWRKNRMQQINQAIAEIKPLWQQHKYKELLDSYQKFVNYLPGYAKVEKLIPKLESLVEKQEINESKDFREGGMKMVKLFWKADKFKEALGKAYELKQYYPTNRKVQKIFEQCRIKYVDYQIKVAQRLEHTEKHYDILRIYKQLLEVTPNYRRLNNLIRKQQRTIRDKELHKKQEYIQLGLAKIREFYSSLDYEQMIQVADEILNYAPKNQEARKWRDRALSEEQKEIDKELLVQLDKGHGQMQTMFDQNDEGWVKI